MLRVHVCSRFREQPSIFDAWYTREINDAKCFPRLSWTTYTRYGKRKKEAGAREKKEGEGDRENSDNKTISIRSLTRREERTRGRGRKQRAHGVCAASAGGKSMADMFDGSSKSETSRRSTTRCFANSSNRLDEYINCLVVTHNGVRLIKLRVH